jgi:hypothetical protein
MWNFVDNLSQDGLDSWYRWLTILAIGLPIFGAVAGGICGWVGEGWVASGADHKFESLDRPSDRPRCRVGRPLPRPRSRLAPAVSAGTISSRVTCLSVIGRAGSAS